MMTENVILYEVHGPVATVTLNRPDKLNSFNGALRAALRRIVGVIEDDPSIRVVVLRGAGRSFCAGADLSDGMADPISFHLDEEYKPFMEGIARSSKIWIGEINGAAAGAGAALAMNCDLMVMADDAYVYMAFAAIALIPDAGNTRLLLEAMGYKRALQAALEGRKIPADECLDYGICNKIVAPDALTEETRAWADRLAAGAPLAMGAAKRLMRSVGAMSFGDAITAEGLEQTPLLKSADFQEGVRAFFSKEKPAFQGE